MTTETETRPVGQPWRMEEAAEYLRCSRRHLERMATQGNLQTFLLGHRRLIADSEVKRLATGG